MAFETPGESFPGSAFYYLADTPYLPLSDAAPKQAQADLALPAPAATGFGAGPAARAMLAAGSPLDRVRAQKCMTMAIYYEAATEADAGQRAVAQVVLNRVAHPSYPDSVCGVVFEGSERSTGCQFSFTCDGSLDRRPEKAWWDRAAKVARAALGGAVYKPVGLATHYHTLAVHPYWADSLQAVGTIGAHRFYRWRGAAGRPAAFHELYGGGEPLPVANRHAPATGTDAADPLKMAGAFEAAFPAASTQAAPLTPNAIAGPAPAKAGPMAESALPQSGAVKPEYARSGQWLKQP